MNPHATEDARLIALCRAAFDAEHERRFADAQRTHREAVAGLTKLVADAGWLDRERKRVARKQIKFHSARVQMLAPIVEGRKTELDVELPTDGSMTKSLGVVAPNGRLPIGLVSGSFCCRGTYTGELWLTKRRRRFGLRDISPTRRITPISPSSRGSSTSSRTLCRLTPRPSIPPSPP